MHTTPMSAKIFDSIKQDDPEMASSEINSMPVFLRFNSQDNNAQHDEEKKEQIHYMSGEIQKFYSIKETLGEGCVGLVKRALRKVDNKQVAV